MKRHKWFSNAVHRLAKWTDLLAGKSGITFVLLWPMDYN